IGSCAMEIHEPRQVRKEATVSEPFHVPQGCLIGANCLGNACRDVSNKGARPSFLKLVEKQVFLLQIIPRMRLNNTKIHKNYRNKEGISRFMSN
ncbi:MAG: hypothetical protein K0Q65_251, partial [Clostridia bacterium]|nr:hypothetical protein [Clostridia bacterium]